MARPHSTGLQVLRDAQASACVTLQRVHMGHSGLWVPGAALRFTTGAGAMPNVC